MKIIYDKLLYKKNDFEEPYAVTCVKFKEIKEYLVNDINLMEVYRLTWKRV